MTTTHESDLELARRVAGGEEAAARSLFDRYGGEMYGFARKMLSDAVAAEDVLQEAMLGVLRSADRYDGRVPLRAWAYGILRHKVADALRRRGREPYYSGEDPEADSFREDGRWVDLEFQPWDESAELLEVVRSCMEQLPHNQREALTLRAIDEMSTRDAAQILELSEDNLRQVLHRARAAVRKCAAARVGEAP